MLKLQEARLVSLPVLHSEHTDLVFEACPGRDFVLEADTTWRDLVIEAGFR